VLSIGSRPTPDHPLTAARVAPHYTGRRFCMSSEPDKGNGEGYEHEVSYDVAAYVTRGGNSGLTEFYAINECTLDQCPIHLHCRHKKVRRQCQIQVKYLRAMSDIILGNATLESFSPVQLMKIGFHLQPLYRALCRLKMEELSLRRPTQLTNTGTRAMHPVYREIRETIKVITTVLKDLGIDDKKVKKEEEGYYEGLFSEEEEKPPLVRRKK